MSQGIPGADSTDQVTHALIQEAAHWRHAAVLGTLLLHSEQSLPYEYTHVNENQASQRKQH